MKLQQLRAEFLTDWRYMCRLLKILQKSATRADARLSETKAPLKYRAKSSAKYKTNLSCVCVCVFYTAVTYYTWHTLSHARCQYNATIMIHIKLSPHASRNGACCDVACSVSASKVIWDSNPGWVWISDTWWVVRTCVRATFFCRECPSKSIANVYRLCDRQWRCCALMKTSAFVRLDLRVCRILNR